MKLNKLTSLFALLLAFGFFMTACDDTTTDPNTPVVTYPTAPTGLMATSIDSKTIAIKWTLSVSESDTTFKGYVIYINNVAQDTLDKGISTVTYTELTENTEYNFTVKSINKSGNLSQTGVDIKWAPAYRFETNINNAAIKMYVTASTLGSGLNLLDVEGGAPKTLKVASIEDWTLGIETKTDGVLKFGPASSLDYNTTGKTLKTVTMVSTPVFANSLNDVFDSEALTSKTFNTSFVDLNTLTTANGKNAVFYVKEMVDGKAHYAKVLVKNQGNGFLNSTDENPYVEVVVSYQKGDDLPYAK